MLTTGAAFKDLGAAHHDTRDKQRTATRCVQRLHRLGYTVILRPVALRPAELA